MVTSLGSGFRGLAFRVTPLDYTRQFVIFSVVASKGYPKFWKTPIILLHTIIKTGVAALQVGAAASTRDLLKLLENPYVTMW